MSDIVVKVENLSKQYRLGEVGTGTLSHDLNRWWHQVRGKQDPYLKIGETNDRATKGNSDLVWALKDISFEVKQGDVLGIIGKNGAGKSTLLKILSKVTGPTTGRIRAKGHVASLLEVGTGFHPELTGRENIYLNGTILGMTKKEVNRKLEEIVDFAGVARYLDTPVKRYSSGMMVRLGFSVAAHLDPEILIVDEVLAVGDAEFQQKCIGKMGDVSKQGRTILFVSHNMASIQSLCNKGILLDNGQISMTSNQIDEVISKYISINNDFGEVSDLSTISERHGNGYFVFTSIKFFDNKNRVANIFKTGDQLKIELEFKSKKLNNLTNINVYIAFFDQYDNCILGLNNEMVHGELFKDLGNRGKITCIVNKINLMPGNYRVAINGQYQNEKADVILRAGRITIEPGDFYGTGKIYPNKNVKTLVEHNWYRNH